MRTSGGIIVEGVIDGQNGNDGNNGYNVATVPLYRRSETVLGNNDRPTGTLTYNFTSGKLTGTNANFNGWSQNVPANSPGTKLYITIATARSQEYTDEIESHEWATPVEYVADGLSNAPVLIYKRASSIGSNDKPANGCVYTFATGALSGTLNGWSTQIPAHDGNPCWVRQATAVSNIATDVIDAGEWSAAQKLVEDGVNGTSPWMADLSNEMASIACNLNGNPNSTQNVSTKISLFHGQNVKTFGTPTVKRNGTAYTVNASQYTNGVKVAYSNGTVTIYYSIDAVISTVDVFTISIVASDDNSITKDLEFYVNGVRPGANGEAATIYNLVPSVSEIVYTKSGTYSPDSMSCYCTSLKNGVATDNPSAATMQYSYNGSSWTNFSSSTTFQSATIRSNGGKLYLRLLVDSKVMDKETIPVMQDGNDGDDAKYIYLKGSAFNKDSAGTNVANSEIKVNGGSNLATQSRGLCLVTLNRQTLAVVDSAVVYDTYDGTTGKNNLITKLNNLGTNVFVCLVSYDAIGWSDSLISLLQTFGMSDIPYTSANRYPFLFIGYKNLGKGNGITRMNDMAEPAIPVELGVYVANGALSVKDGKDGEDGDDAVTYDIVLNTAWAKVDSSEIITAGLAGTAYKIVGSTRSVLASTTIRYGYILNNSTTYADTTTDGSGNFDAGTWFNGDNQNEYAKGSNNIFAAIVIDGSVKCVKYVTIANQGAKGDTGRMYYIAGEFPKKAPYQRTANLCPVVYYATEWWYLKAASANANNVPSDGSAYWAKIANFGVVLTDAIFVKNFAQFGAAIITGDWLISVHGTINGVYYGGSVEAPGEYNNRAAYTYFDPAYPMGFESFQIPVKTEEIDKGYNTEWTRITNNFSLTAGTYIIKITCHVNSSDTMHLRLFDDNDSSDAYYLGSTTSDEVVTLVYTKTISTGSSKFNLRAGMKENGEIGYIESIEIESTDARFVPNYAVDLRTGRSYQNDANIRGKIVTIGPSSKVEISEGVIRLYGAYNFPNIVLGVDANGCAVLNFYDKNGVFTYGLGPIEAERTQSQAESFTLQYYNIDDGSYDATEIPNSAIVTVYRYMFKSQVPPSSTFLKKYLAKIMANAYFGGNYCASGEEARYFNGKFIKASYHSPFQTGDVYGGGIVVTCNNPQSGIISSKETMLNGRTVEELELRGYEVMQDSNYNRTKEGDVYYYNTKDVYNPVQAFWLDTSAGGSKGYGSGYTWFGYINLIVDPTDWNEDKLADPIYWFNLQYIDSKGVGSYKTLYVNKSKLQAILQNAGYSL